MAAGKTLAYSVGLREPMGNVVSFVAGTPFAELPDWAQKQATGEHLFGKGSDTSGGDPAAGDPPPKSGKGSGEDKWRDYAESHGLDVSDLKDREEIISALESEGIRTE